MILLPSLEWVGRAWHSFFLMHWAFRSCVHVRRMTHLTSLISITKLLQDVKDTLVSDGIWLLTIVSPQETQCGTSSRSIKDICPNAECAAIILYATTSAHVQNSFVPYYKVYTGDDGMPVFPKGYQMGDENMKPIKVIGCRPETVWPCLAPLLPPPYH